MEKNYYSIQFVSKITGINHHTLRAWEKRYQAVVPDRDGSGRRTYTQDQVERLKLLHELVNAGSAISSIAGLETEELKNRAKEVNPNRGNISSSPVANLETTVDIHTALQNLLVALKSYKLDIISYELEKLSNSISPRDFALSVLAPLMGEVGVMCEAGQLSIAQEHALSAIVRFHVGVYLYGHQAPPMEKELNIILGTPEGEFHEFGILVAALLCSHYRIRHYFLGSNLPMESLSIAAEQINSKLIILGISKHFESKHIQSAFDYVDRLSSNVGEDVEIWAGGFPLLPKGLKYEKIKVVSTLQMLDYQLARLY